MANWTPTIVGGTDHSGRSTDDTDTGNVKTLTRGVQRAASSELVITTHEKLSAYCNTIPEGIDVRWDYGPVISIPHGMRMQRGQTVTEYHNEVAHQVYWVPS